MENEFVVFNIGVTANGKSVVRVRTPKNDIIEVETNVVSFAKLAEAGLAVRNGAGV